jgi:hypothetical protein
VAAELQVADAAASLFGLLEPWHGQVADNGLTIQGPVAHYLGGLAAVLQRYDTADGYFAEAARMSEHMQARFFGARTEVAWARMLLARGRSGDAERARQLLAQAYETGTRLGYASVARRAVQAGLSR